MLCDDNQISIYRLGTFEHGCEVLTSLTIKANFSWTLSYKKQIVNPENSSVIKDTPQFLNSGEPNDYQYLVHRWSEIDNSDCVLIDTCTSSLIIFYSFQSDESNEHPVH